MHRKTLVPESLFKVVGLRFATLLKKRLWHRCFPVNFVEFLRTPLFIEHLWWLLLFRDGPKQIVATTPKKALLIALPFLWTFSMNLRTRVYKSVSKTCNMNAMQCKSYIFSLNIDWVVCLNSGTPFLYIFALTLVTNFSVVIAILLPMARLNVILKLELMNILVCSHWQQNGSITTENLPLKVTAFS